MATKKGRMLKGRKREMVQQLFTRSSLTHLAFFGFAQRKKRKQKEGASREDRTLDLGIADE